MKIWGLWWVFGGLGIGREGGSKSTELGGWSGHIEYGGQLSNGGSGVKVMVGMYGV